jgi:glycosyltransferase involved in cell wall biosynthesis
VPVKTIDLTGKGGIMSTHNTRNLISLVVPFYNEGEAVDQFFAQIVPVLEAIEGIRFEIVCVNDGSSDTTLDKLIAASAKDARVRVVDLTRNFGKEAALTAGLDEALGDAVIPIDADLQDSCDDRTLARRRRSGRGKTD